MGLEKLNKTGGSLLGRFDKDNEKDMLELEVCKKMIKVFNKDSNNTSSWGSVSRPYKWRLEKKSRSVYKKGISKKTGNPITYIPLGYGQVFGGMANTKTFDLYLYRRYA